MNKLKPEPQDKVAFTAFFVVRFQKMLNKNTTDKEGAKKPKTA